MVALPRRRARAFLIAFSFFAFSFASAAAAAALCCRDVPARPLGSSGSLPPAALSSFAFACFARAFSTSSFFSAT